jgi:hypothetical protein
MMEAVRTSETSVDNYFTRQYTPKDNSELHTVLNFLRTKYKVNMEKQTLVLQVKEQWPEIFFSKTCSVVKYTKLLIALSKCEHKKYSIANIFSTNNSKITVQISIRYLLTLRDQLVLLLFILVGYITNVTLSDFRFSRRRVWSLVFWDVAPLSSPWWWRQYAALKHRSASTWLHGATSQKTVNFKCYSIYRLCLTL